MVRGFSRPSSHIFQSRNSPKNTTESVISVLHRTKKAHFQIRGRHFRKIQPPPLPLYNYTNAES